MYIVILQLFTNDLHTFRFSIHHISMCEHQISPFVSEFIFWSVNLHTVIVKHTVSEPCSTAITIELQANMIKGEVYSYDLNVYKPL